jgi:hypothetical protein
MVMKLKNKLKTIKLYSLIFFLFIIGGLSAQSDSTYTLSTTSTTSCGVYKGGRLVRTLWNNKVQSAGTYYVNWNKRGDSNQVIYEPYTIKVISNRITTRWKANIGNTSIDSVGPNKIRALRTPTDGVEVGNAIYFSTGFVEGNSSTFKILKSNIRRMVPVRPSQCGDADGEIRFCATDSVLVYWAGIDAWSRAWPSTNTTPPDTNSWADCFIYATRVSNDADYTFSSGSILKPSLAQCRTYSAIGISLKDTTATPTGLAVMKTGNYLYLTQKKKGLVKCYNKTTGALIRTITLSLGDICIKDSVVYGISGNSVRGYKINSNGTLTANSFNVSITSPLNVSCNGGLILVTISSSQQIKAYNTSGTLQWTHGQAGGYKSSPSAAYDKFQFIDYNDISAKGFTIPCLDGSFWVGDAGNFRQVHFSSSRNYIEKMGYIPMNYNASASKVNPKRVFAGFVEFDADSNKLIANWGGNLKPGYLNIYRRDVLSDIFVTNNRTFANITYYPNGVYDDGGRIPEYVELTDTGIRYTGIRLTQPNNRWLIYSTTPNGDRFRYEYTQANSGIDTVFRQKFTGLNNNGNPTWATQSVFSLVPITANAPIRYCGEKIDSTLVFFSANWANSGYHLGKVVNNKWTWMTCPSTSTSYTGPMPVSDSFDCGNGVEYAGGRCYNVDSFYTWNYIGEFWKNSQTNVWKLFHKDGLMLVNFGKTGPQSESISGTSDAPIEAAGNGFAGNMVKDGNKLKIYYNDESRHGAIGSFEVSGLNTIAIDNISYPLDVALPYTLYDIKINCVNNTSSLLTWKISETSEYNNYLIEYSNINDKWVKLNTINCNNNPTYNEYSILLNNSNNISLYRLSIVKKDGTVEVIKTIRTRDCGKEEFFKVYPNPFKNTFKVEVPTFVDEYRLVILDNLGKVVYDNTCSGNQEITNMGSFGSGIYFVQIMYQGDILYQNKLSKNN